MQFPTRFLLAFSTLSDLATLTLAAECSSTSGSQICLDRGAVWDLRQHYCANQWNTQTWRVGLDSSGNIGQIWRQSISNNQQECWDSIGNIIDQCYGKANGGSWSLTGLMVNIDYCLTVYNLKPK